MTLRKNVDPLFGKQAMNTRSSEWDESAEVTA
jgi:hypothetical protein